MKPLSGITVLDLTRLLSGPFCTMTLADLGADIIKIEAPPHGDDARTNPPFKNEESVYFMSINRGKQSIAIDLKSQEGKEILFKMVKNADVLVENFRPGTMEKLGIGYERLAAINEKLVFCSISGFGQDGPYRDRPAYDIIVQAMSGLMSITGEEDGKPTRVGVSIGDIIAGLYGAIGILAAVNDREKDGKGQYLDIGMLDCMVAIAEYPLARYLIGGYIPKRLGNKHSAIYPWDVFKTKDGEIVLAVHNSASWNRFSKIMDSEIFMNDSRFKDNPSRKANESALEEMIKKILLEKTTREWIEIFAINGIPCGPLNTIPDLPNDPQINHRGMIVEIKGHKKVGTMKVAGQPIKFSKVKTNMFSPAPLIAEHTDKILKRFGFKENEIKKFKENKSIM